MRDHTSSVLRSSDALWGGRAAKDKACEQGDGRYTRAHPIRKGRHCRPPSDSMIGVRLR